MLKDMQNHFWKIFAKWLVASESRVDWLIKRAQLTPYFHLEGYMERWWIIRPHKWLPFSIRIHHILREDYDRSPHNHPWAFRTIILRGWYEEEFRVDAGSLLTLMEPGETCRRGTEDFHRIAAVSNGGVWTLFICGRKSCDWGFMVDGEWVYWREYLNDWS